MTDSSDTPGRADRSGDDADVTSDDTTSADAESGDAAASDVPGTDTDDAGTADVATSGTTDTGAPPRKVLIAAVALAVALVAGVGAVGLFGRDAGSDTDGDAQAGGDTGPLPLVSIPAPEAGSDACRRMLEAVPEELTSSGRTLERRELAEPAPPAAAAWGRDNPVVLRCGLDRPPELTRTSSLRQINGVQWLHVPDESGPSATWYVVDRPVHLALTVPEGTGTGTLQRMSDLADEHLKQVSPF